MPDAADAATLQGARERVAALLLDSETPPWLALAMIAGAMDAVIFAARGAPQSVARYQRLALELEARA